MKIYHSVLLVASLIGSTPVWATDTDWRSVTGKNLFKTFAEHELGDNVHFAYQFKSDGTFSGYEMTKNVRGKWRTTATQICWAWIKPLAAEECFEVLKWKNNVRLFKNRYETEGGMLTPIKNAH